MKPNDQNKLTPMRLGLIALIVVLGLYAIAWWVLFFTGFYQTKLSPAMMLNIKSFLPASVFVFACVAGFVAEFRKQRLSAYFFGFLACGGVLYASIHVGTALLSGGLPMDLITNLIGWPYLIAGGVGAIVLWRDFGRRTRVLGSARVSTSGEPAWFTVLFVLGLGAFVWWILVIAKVYTYKTFPLMILHAQTFLPADLFFILCLAGMLFWLKSGRLSAYLVGFLACGVMIYRSILIITAIIFHAMAQDVSMKLMGLPYLLAGLVGTGLLWRDLRRHVETMANKASAQPLALSLEPIIPEVVRNRLEAVGLFGLARDLFVLLKKIWFRVVWKVIRTGQDRGTWMAIVPGAQGRGEEVLKEVEDMIKQTSIPVKQERRTVAPGIIRGILGVKREFLMVVEVEHPALRRWHMFVGARDYGLNLQVYCCLTYRPKLRESIVAVLSHIPGVNLLFLPATLAWAMGTMAAERRGGLALDFFDETDLAAYSSLVRSSAQKATKNLSRSLNQDPEKIEETSRGFLGVS